MHIIFSRVRHYITTGLAAQLVDPDGGQRKIENQQLLENYTLPADGWTVNLEEFPSFCYEDLFAHLISNSKTIASKQKPTRLVL